MALPGPAKGLAVATVTYINYPKRFSLFGAGAMAPRAPREPARHRARHPTPPALRGAPGAEGDRSRIRWTPAGVPDGQHWPDKSCSCVMHST